MPNKLFISYPSESWNFAQRIAEKLAERLDESIFIDYRSIDQADFATAILTHLQASHAVLLIVTEFTFADIHRDRDWVRLEIRTALENRIPIVLVRENGLLPPPDLPDDVKDVQRSQGIPFYREFFDPGIDMLAAFLVRIGVGTPKSAGTPPKLIEPTPAPIPTADPEPEQRVIGGQRSLDEAADLLESGDHDKALLILETLREQGNLRSVAAKLVADLIAEAQARRAAAERRREASLDYETIAAMAKRKLTEASARAEFTAWCQRYPDLVEELDTDHLRARFQPPRKSSRELLPPPFDWIKIPAGRVTLVTEKGWVANYIPEGRPQTFEVPAFSIAKYPVTNAQFRLFWQAKGYATRRWWTEAGWEARLKGWIWKDDKFVETNQPWTEPRFWTDSAWNGDEQPVVGVSWYEAAAYCRWLSELTGEAITLPTEQQWQRAAQGDDGRAYPWGPNWDGSRCSNNVDGRGIGRTTPVRQYEGKGDSPFGVVDMAGNVWEWCLTAYTTGSTSLDGTDVRILRGGSWGDDNSDFFRCGYRNWDVPRLRYSGGGFRLALSEDLLTF